MKQKRRLKYPFDRIPFGRYRTIKCDNPKSCQRAALIYAAKNGLKFKTILLPDEGVRIYNRTEV